MGKSLTTKRQISLLLISVLLICLTAGIAVGCTKPPSDTAETNGQAAPDESVENESDDSASSGNAQNGYYISITGSYRENGVLSEVYATYELNSGGFKEHLKVPATSSYPCSVCDLTEGKVYYTVAEECELGGRVVMLDNLYVYDTVSGETSMLTTDGFFTNKMIKVDNRLYIAGAPRSTVGVRFCWIDLNTGEMVFPDLFETPGYTDVRDISYSFERNEMYMTWHDGREQSRLDQEFYVRQEDKTVTENFRELTPHMLDVVDMKTLEVTTLDSFTDFQTELISVAQDGSRVFMYAIYAEDTGVNPFRLYENGSSADFIYPGTALALLDADGDTLYYILRLDKETEGVPHTAIYSYNFVSGETTELCEFPFYVNNMTMMKK